MEKQFWQIDPASDLTTLTAALDGADVVEMRTRMQGKVVAHGSRLSVLWPTYRQELTAADLARFAFAKDGRPVGAASTSAPSSASSAAPSSSVPHALVKTSTGVRIVTVKAQPAKATTPPAARATASKPASVVSDAERRRAELVALTKALAGAR